MPKNVPTKKAPAKTEAAPATAAPAAPKEWTDLEIAVQMEVTPKGEIVNPFTKEVIAKDANGLLDVRRPGGKAFPKPENVKIVGSVAASFGKWFMEKCQIAPLTAEEASERFGKPVTLPPIEVNVEEVPYAFVTGKLGDDSYGFHVINGQISRMGRRTERGYVWAISNEFLKVRGKNMCPRNTAGDAHEVFRSMLSSFAGKFQHDPKPVAAPKAKTAPAKTAPKSAPKKVPAKK